MTTTTTAVTLALATNHQPATLPAVPTDERLSFAVDQFTESGHRAECRCAFAGIHRFRYWSSDVTEVQCVPVVFDGSYCPSMFCIAPVSAFTAGPPSPD